METTVEEREMEIIQKDGSVHKVKGTITTTHHGTKDKDGNPKISVNVGVSPIEGN